MTATLYVVHGSHPCATVERALELKGIPFKIVEFPPPMHMAVMKLLFGKRTVPGPQGQRREDHRLARDPAPLDELRPEPALLPADPAERAQVEAAEAWGDEVLQGLVRRVLWPTFKAHPEAMATFSDGSKLPPIPVPVLKLIAPVATRIEMKANAATPATYPVDLRTPAGACSTAIDGWIADGVMGGEQPNAADLQIATSLRLLMAFADLRPLIESRPRGQLALRLFPEFPGDVPGRRDPGRVPARRARAAA